MYSEKNISPKIKKLLPLTEKRISTLADLLGISRNTTNNWVNKLITPSIEYIVPIAEFFDVPIEYLFSDTMPESASDIPLLHPHNEEQTLEMEALCMPTEEEQPSKLSKPSQQQPSQGMQAITTTESIIRPLHTEKSVLHDKITELVEIFTHLKPLGQYQLLAEAYWQLQQQKDFMAEAAAGVKSPEENNNP